MAPPAGQGRRTSSYGAGTTHRTTDGRLAERTDTEVAGTAGPSSIQPGESQEG